MEFITFTLIKQLCHNNNIFFFAVIKMHNISVVVVSLIKIKVRRSIAKSLFKNLMFILDSVLFALKNN